MVYNAKFEVLTCSLSGIPVRIVLSKREPNPPIANPERIGVSGFRIKQKDTDVVTEPINGSELSITLVSDANFNSDVLETEDERDWKTEIFFNGDLYWSGFNLPEGLSKPYDNDSYDIGVKATDTLGNLKEVPFIDITPYKGFDTDKNIIVKCLSKTGLALPIVIGVNVFESQMNQNDCPLTQSSINQDRFIDSSSKPFSCHEVLRSILERYGAKLFQAKGAWYIVNTLEATKGNVPAWKYDYTGAFIEKITINDLIVAGAASDEAPILDRTHDISKARAFKSSMSYYQFGFVKNAITNGDFNTVAAGFFPGWQKLNGVNSGVADSTETDLATGVTVVTGHSLIVFEADTSLGQMVRSTNPIQVRANEKVTISFDMVVYNLGAPINDYELQLIIIDNSGRSYSKDGWKNYGVPYGLKLNGADIADRKIFNVNFEIPAGSSDYQLTFAFAQVYRKSGNNYSPRETHFDNLSVSVSVADAVLTPAVGQYLRLSQPKNLTFTSDAALLLHGDEASNLRTSQILIGANPTSQWNRSGFGLSENKPLLYIVADSILRLNSKPKNIIDAKFASKEIISPISLFNINQISGIYLLLSGEFDLLNEEYKLILFEGINESVNIITPYETGTDTGNLKDKTGVSIGQPSGINNPPSNNTSPNSGLVSRLSEDNGYLLLDGLKVNAGYSDFAQNSNHANLADYATNANHANIADLATRALRADLADYALDSDKWDGAQFSDYLNQAVKVTSDVRHKSLSSPSYASGFTGYGFQIDENGNATFDNLTVRKQMNVYELTVNKINATNGALAVTDTIKLLATNNTGAYWDCGIDTAGGTILVPFRLNDLIRCQVWNGTGIKYYFAQVIGVAPDGSSFSIKIIDGAGVPAAGDVVARFGNTTNTNRQGLLYLTASDTNAPYMDVLDGITSANLTGKTKIRLGKLNGIVDADFGALSGYGLYGENVYLTNGKFKGEITVTGGNAATQVYAVNQASSYSNAALSAAQSYASSVATTAGNNALSAAQTYALNQATQAKADAIANAASNAFAQSYAAGKMLYRDPEFAQGFNGISVYNNSGNGNVTIGRGQASDWTSNPLPNSSGWYAAIGYNGGGGVDPGLGGFYWNTPSRANAIYIVRLVAFIPIGFTLQWTTNPIGGGGVIYSTDVSGVGNWKEYLIVVKCGQSGTFGGTNFLYLTGPNVSVGWYLASATVYDMTAVEADPLAYTDTKATATITAAQAYADSVATSKANIAQTAAISTASADATAKANAARSNAVGDSQALINSIQIGAVNILDGSKITNTTAGYLLFSSTLSEPLMAGQQYTFSARIDSALQNFGIWSSAGTIHLGFLTYISGTGIYTITFIAPTTNGNLNFQIYNMSNQGGAVETASYYYSKLERGSKRSDWSPSVNDVNGSIATAQTTANNAVTAYNSLTASLKPMAFESVVELSKLGNTVISNGMLSNTLIDTNYIRVNVINAGYIESLEIVSKSIRTANSGVKRVEITQSTNSVILYSASNEELVKIDDNLAVLTPGNAVTPATYGAGIRIGQGGATTSLSRYGFSVTSPDGALYPKTFIGTVGSGYTGFASIDVEGGFNVKNLEHYFGGTGKGDFKLVAGNVLDYNGNQINVMLVVPL